MLDVMCNEIILQVKDGHKTEWILCTSEEGKFLLGTHSSTIFTILMYVTQENQINTYGMKINEVHYETIYNM